MIALETVLRSSYETLVTYMQAIVHYVRNQLCHVHFLLSFLH